MNQKATSTFAEAYQNSVASFPDKILFLWREEATHQMTYQQSWAEVAKFCHKLKKYGLEYSDYIVYWGPTSVPALILDLACQRLGVVFVGISPSMSLPLVLDTVAKTTPKLIFCDDIEFEQFSSSRPLSSPSLALKMPRKVSEISSWDSRSTQDNGAAIKDAISEPKLNGESVSSIFFTSGTTGSRPKGVIHTNSSILNASEVYLNRLNTDENVHIISNATNILLLIDFPLSVIHNSLLPYIMAFGSTIALDKPCAEAFQIYQPDSFFVPGGNLVDLQKSIVAKIEALGFFKKFVIKQAIEFLKSRRLSFISTNSFVENKLGFIASFLDSFLIKKIRDNFGFRIRSIYVSASGPSVEASEFFWAIGIPVWNAYVSTECPIVACNYAKAIKLNSAGKPAENLETKIDDSTGCVLIKGPSLFSGYLGEPARKPDEWFDTGDIAVIDGDGYLKISGRARNRIKLTCGYILNAESVESVMLNSPYVSQICVFGDNQKFLIALVYPSPLCRMTIGSVDKSKLLLENFSQLHRTHGLQKYEKIERLLVISEGFSVENGLLTATKKLRKSEIYSRYKAEIERLYLSL